MKYAYGAVPFVALLLGGVSCETDFLEDPGFQFWCGERLCEWDTREGTIKRVPTWHQHDYGVELVGAPVHLTQEFVSGISDCALVETVADIDADAAVVVSIDADGDGTPEWEQTLGGEGFVARSWEVEIDVDDAVFMDFHVEKPFRGLASIRKNSVGRAVIARLRVSRECFRDRGLAKHTELE